jgi:predicted RNA-binding Zn ribbon-like protein
MTRMTPVFDLIGGELCLDFANTVDNRGDPTRRRELLTAFGELVAWGRQAGILSTSNAAAIMGRASRAPQETRDALARAVRLRDALYAVFSAIAQRQQVRTADLDLIGAADRESAAHQRLVPSGNGFAWEWSSEGAQFDRVLWRVARSATDLLTSDRIALVRQCADNTCTWLFLDTSRNKMRRWCDMRVCGNRAKVRSFYGRTRKKRPRHRPNG